MTLKETGEIFFGFSLYFDNKFDFVASNYRIPGWFEKQCIHYIKSHENSLNQFRQYGKRTVIVFALLNQLKYRMKYSINYEMNNSDSIYFFDLLNSYHVYFREDIEFLVNNLSEMFDLYVFHSQKKIQWFTMAYVLALLKFDGKDIIIQNELIKQEMKYITKALKVFRFKQDVLLEILQPLQHKMDLR